MSMEDVERPEEPNVNDPRSPHADMLERIMDGAESDGILEYTEITDGFSATTSIRDLPATLNLHFLVTCRPLPDVPPDLAAEVVDPVVVAEKMAILAQQIDDITGCGWDKAVSMAEWVMRAADRKQKFLDQVNAAAPDPGETTLSYQDLKAIAIGELPIQEILDRGKDRP